MPPLPFGRVAPTGMTLAVTATEYRSGTPPERSAAYHTLEERFADRRSNEERLSRAPQLPYEFVGTHFDWCHSPPETQR